MKKGVVQTKFWKRGLAATLAAAMLCGNFLEVGSSLKVFAEDGVASNAGVTVNIDTDFSTLTLENVPSNVDIPLNIQVDEAELTAKTENLEEEQKSAAQNAYQAEMQAGFEQKLNELLEGKSVVDYTGAQDAPNIGVVTAVSFDENGSVDDISFIGVNTGAESREITVSLTHPIEVDKAASGLQTVELDAQLNLDAFKEEEAPDNGDQSESETETPDNSDQSESETETPDNGDQSESETETPDNGDQSESETETPDNGDQSESETETPDNGDQSESETETPDNGDQSEGDESNSKNQELTPDSTPAGVNNQSASYSELTDHFSVGTNDDLSNLEDPDKETTPPTDTETPEETTPPTGTETPEETTPPTGTETPDDMPKNYWNISANPKVNEGNISFTEAISPAANFAVEEASDTALISALSFMVPGDSIAQVGLKGHDHDDDDDKIDNQIPSIPANPGTGSGESVETHFSASKTSSEKSGAGIYDITLMVDGIDGTKLTEEVAEQNVLFVIDLSGSMTDYIDHGRTKWSTLKSAMKSMTYTLEAANHKNGNKIKAGIVGYASNYIGFLGEYPSTAAKKICGFTNPASAYGYINDDISDVRGNMGTGTNCEAGALKAIEMLGEKPTTIIYLTDGDATYSYKKNGYEKGYGSSFYEIGAKEARNVLEAIGDRGYNIHTIGFGDGIEHDTVIKDDPTHNIFYHDATDTEDLAEIFNDLAMSITGQKVANTDVTVTDPMSEHVDIAKADGSLFMTGNKLMSAKEQVDAIEQDPSALGITFKKTTYKMGLDGKPVMDNDGKPQVNDIVTVTFTNRNLIDGKNYNQLLEEVSFNTVDNVVQLTWTPGVNNKDGHKELSGKYELTYTVNVKADQDNFVSGNNYDANRETKVSGSVDGKNPSTSSIPVPTVQQTQNTLTIKKTGTDNKTLSGAEFVVSFTDDAGNTKYLAKDHSGSSAVYTDTINSAQHFTTSEDGTVTIGGLYDYVYTVEEVKAPDGYSKLVKSFTVDFTGKEGKTASGTVKQDGTVDGSLNTGNSTGEVTVQNAPSTGSITVTKELKDASGSSIQKENNPTFIVKLTKDGDQVGNSQELKWNNTAYNQVTFNNLEAGTYTITEYLADGTLASSKYDVAVNGSQVTDGQVTLSGGQTVDVTITNTEKADGSITVTKELKGYNGGTPSSTDKTFYVALYQDDNTSPVTDTTVTKNGSTVTNNNGVYEIKANETLTFSKLPYGTYTVKEVVQKDGQWTPVDDTFDYTVSGSETSVTLNVNNTTDNVTITNTEKANGSITVTKELLTSDGTGLNDTSRTFYVALYQGDEIFTGGTVSSSTGTNGVYTIHDGETLTFSDLPYGTYTVKEVVQKDGQWTPVGNDFDYTVTDSGTPVTLNVGNKTGNVQFTNTEKNNGQISVTKTVTEPTGNVIPAPLNGDEVFYVALYQGNEIFTGATVDGFTSVKNGIYPIHNDETLTFSDLPYGIYTVKEVTEDGTPVVDTDPNFGFNVSYDPTTASSDGIVVRNSQVNTVTITNTRKVEGSIVLKKVIEVASNDPDDDKTFTFQITGGGITTPISVTIEPDSATGALKEVDLLQALKDEGVTEIYGKEFTITEQPHDYYTLENIVSASEDKPNASTGLKGFLEALLAPRNADPSCTFTPERDKSITITATNTAKTGSIVINKVDNAEKALPGVTFGLYTDVNATTPFTQNNGAPVTATTDDNGTATFGNVPVGTYYLKETAVPAGYAVSDVIFKVTVASDGTTTKVTENMISSGNAEFTDNDELINTPTAITPEIKVTKAAATGDEAFIKADNKEYTVQITGNESPKEVILKNANNWTEITSDFALMPNVEYTVSEAVPEGANWALDNIAITFKDSSGNTVDVTVDENNSFTLKPEQASKVTSIEIVVTNKAKRSEVQLEVTEQVIGNLLEAEKNTFNFTVKGPDGTFTGLVTVKDGNVTKVSGWDAGSAEVAELPKLIPGETYTITQTSNPEYLLNDINEDLKWNGSSNSEARTFTFTVPEDAKGTYTVAFTNYANTIPVTLTKVLEDNARPLNPDDQFDFDITTIQDDGHAFTTAAAVTTTNSATFNLIKGKTYTIKEVAIPDGYQLVSIAMNGEVLPSTKDVNPSYSFTIPTDATEIKLVATNRILGSYDFIKMGKVTTITQRPNGTVISRTETTNPLAGATFTLKDKDDVLLQTVESAADGKVSFNNLPAGEYIIEEASAPSGFNKWNYQIDLTLSIDGDGDMTINAEPTDDRGTEVKDYMLYIYNYREDIITEQDPPIPPTDPEDPGDPRPSGGGDETTTRTIEDTPTPTTTIEDEDVPLAPLPNDMITIDDEDVPLGDLPYTGGLPFELVGVLGIALVGTGLVLRKKNKKD